MKEENLCRISGDYRDMTHDEWLKKIEGCGEKVPVNEQKNFWTVGERGWYIPKETDNLVDDMDKTVKRKRSELSYNKKHGYDTKYLEGLIGDLTNFKNILK